MPLGLYNKPYRKTGGHQSSSSRPIHSSLNSNVKDNGHSSSAVAALGRTGIKK